MKRLILALAVCATLFINSCSITYHTVGDGAQGETIVRQKAWYVLFGLVALNKGSANSKNMIPENVENYDIKVKTGFGDGVIGVLANILVPTTIAVQTVEVKY